MISGSASLILVSCAFSVSMRSTKSLVAISLISALFFDAKRYDLAKDLLDRVVKTFANGIRKTGIADECYSPKTGEPIMNQNFISWNSLIIKMIDESEKF